MIYGNCQRKVIFSLVRKNKWLSDLLRVRACVCVWGTALTTGWPLLTGIPSWSIMLREMVMEGRSRLWGGNWGIKAPLCGTGGSGITGKGESTSDRPRPDSVSGGGVMGGISNSSSPKLGVWKVYKRRSDEEKRRVVKNPATQNKHLQSGALSNMLGGGNL